MEYQELVQDFAERTMHNLRLVRDRVKDGDEAYEVTQLINSMLGLLVFPQQHYIDRIPARSLDELRADGWPESVLAGEVGQPEDLRGLMRLLRNGIAHMNLQFTEHVGVLSGVRIWNMRDGKKTWEAHLSLQDLERITERFVKLITEQAEQ